MKFPFQLTLLAQTLALGLAGYAHAETVSKPDNQPVLKQELEEVTVRAVVPSNVTTLDKEELKKSAAQNIDDMVLYEPGVDVQSDNLRLGHTNVMIRGIGNLMQSNAIQMNLDGIPLPDQQSDIGPGGRPVAVNGRDTVEMDTLKRVSIFKGGNGTAQGDGALAGSVNMQTYLPSDFVSDEKPWYFGLNYGYRSTYRSHGVTATAAGKAGPASGLLMLTRRNLHESDNYADVDENGAARQASNKQDAKQYNILLKGDIRLENHHIDATAEQFVRDTLTNRQDLFTTGVTAVAENDDKAKRRRFALGYRYVPSADFDAGVRAYHQSMDSHDYQTQRALSGAYGLQRHTYEQKIKGVRGDVNKTWHLGGVRQELKAGLEYRQTDTDRLRYTDNLSLTNPAQTATTINRYFPENKRTVFSKYLQSQTTFGNGIVLGLGLRHEDEKTKFKPDAAYQVSLADTSLVKDMANKVWLPSAGLTIPLGKHWSTSIAYRRGFRSPDVNFAGSGFTNARGFMRYRVVPNPNLKPESSNNVEAGVRYQSEKLNFAFTAFQSRYRDFINVAIERSALTGYMFDALYDNMNKVKTQGWEASLKWNVTPQWKLLASAADMSSRTSANERSITGDYPLNGVFGVAYEQEKWGVSSRWRWAKKQKRVAVADAGVFQTPGYGVVDLTAYWKPLKNFEIDAGVYNLFDKKYWTTADTAGLAVRPTATTAAQIAQQAAQRAAIERAAQPGRNFAINFAVKF